MNHEFWYLSRAAGFVAYLLLFVSVVLGMAMGTRLIERFARRNVVFDLHRFTTLLALAFTLFHVSILLGDGYFSFNVWELSLPFLTPYRTWQTAVGVFTLYGLALVSISFYVRQFIGYRVWRILHYLTFGLFAGALLHSITAGTDTNLGWAQLIYAATGLATLAVIAYRLQYHIPPSELIRRLRVASGAATALVAVLLLVAAVATSRNQPSAATSTAVQQGVTPQQPAPPNAAYPFLASFNAGLAGTYSQTGNASDSSLTLDATTTGDLALKLHLELVTTGGGGQNQATVTLNKAQLLDVDSNAVVCNGQLTAFSAQLVRATCDGAGPYQGVRMTFEPILNAASATTVNGSLSGTMQHAP